ncbi:type VII secretion target [Mycolicibacterium sp. BiH015]|uniref:type VII secretion target n=1 Tax=Mycolicibacterium sp. BiH015 TaxID=3018808 RepID=UPI0022E1354C|nr:type VII secretion target [Mycolicibacterium sp. BiH015]MDA2891645.1 type VII secretion target [Mycolicibacterium sp. BiH015]
MMVNPDILRAFAGQVETTSVAIREADVGTKVSTAADGLAGSTTQWAAKLVGTHVGTQVKTIADNIAKMGTAVRGTGDSYEVTDTDLAGNFTGIF